MSLILNLIFVVVTLGIIAYLIAIVIRFLMQSFVLPIVLPLIGAKTTGKVTNVAVRTYSGSYGRRFVKTIITYEFYSNQQLYWRKKIFRGQPMRLGRGDLIQVFYLPGLPMVHWVHY